MSASLIVRLPVPMGDDFDDFDGRIFTQLCEGKKSEAASSSASASATPLVAHVLHSHFALTQAECATINRWFLEGRLQCDEMMESFFDTREGVFWRHGSRWLKLQRSIAASSGRKPSSEERAGFWTLKWETERETEVEYKEISYRNHPERSNNPESIVTKLRDEFDLPLVVKSAAVSPLSYLPVNICSYFNYRYSPKKVPGLH